ncbi:Pimeloyl-ACP methyl ester carboxylesterase [Riemerella columbipharyngis]|uniref:Pimeloyl-ACP methyl ester carboxylesterase n=2 Tax=Riemerella columbipharyngis TaxID=1071918 RepID=A0A1G6ZMU6_9FLAO|nr:Pimeloyl-ACP methyl ester carboxylesterase [Riemerella columbipharyngis]
MEILHSKIYGKEQSATPLLVFHGLFGMLDNWGSFGREFGELIPTHLLDLRNHGKSFHSNQMSHDDMAEDILNYMNANHIEKAHLLGHSLGGKAVMQFAVKYPEKVEKLIVVDISPKAYPPHHQGVIKALKTVDFDKITSRQGVVEHLSQYIHEPAVIQFLAKNLYWTEEKKLNWRFNLDTLCSEYNTMVANAITFSIFNGETLFIGGEKSNYILPQDEFLIKQQFPNAKILKVPNAAHWVQADNSKYFNQAVKDFLLKN